AATNALAVFSLLPAAKEAGAGEYHELMKGVGRLWLAGVPINWSALHGDRIRNKVTFPLYPFQRQHFPADLIIPTRAQRAGESGILIPWNTRGVASINHSETGPASTQENIQNSQPGGMTRYENLCIELRKQLHE